MQSQGLSWTVILLPRAGDEAVAIGGGEAAELDVRALAAHRRHLGRGRADERGAVAVEIRLALVPVVGVLLAHPVRALDVLHEEEGARAHHVRLVPAHVLGEDVGLVDPVPGRCEVQQEGRLRPLEPEADGLGIRSLDHLDRPVGALPRGRDALGRKDDLVVGGLDVPRGHGGAVVELHALPKLEGVDQAVLGDGPGLRQVPDRLRARLVEGVHAQERVVVRGHRMHDAEGFLAVRIVGRRLRRHHELQLTAVARLVLSARGPRGPDQRHEGHRGHRQQPPPVRMSHVVLLQPAGRRLCG